MPVRFLLCHNNNSLYKHIKIQHKIFTQNIQNKDFSEIKYKKTKHSKLNKVNREKKKVFNLMKQYTFKERKKIFNNSKNVSIFCMYISCLILISSNQLLFILLKFKNWCNHCTFKQRPKILLSLFKCKDRRLREHVCLQFSNVSNAERFFFIGILTFFHFLRRFFCWQNKQI